MSWTPPTPRSPITLCCSMAAKDSSKGLQKISHNRLFLFHILPLSGQLPKSLPLRSSRSELLRLAKRLRRMAIFMNRLFKLQFLGPLALFVATACAELAARALSSAPGSEILWFVNLRMFGIFQRSHAALPEFVTIEGFQLAGIALPIFLLACYGLAARRRLPLALASHLSFAY